MIVKRFKCREHRAIYNYYSIKSRGLFCNICIGEFKYEGPDLIQIISENNFLSAICYLTNYTFCEIDNNPFEFYCKSCFAFHCRSCAGSRCSAHLIALNPKILQLDEQSESVLAESIVKSRKYKNYNSNSKEYFEFLKFQLKKYKRRREDFSVHFNNRTFDFNNSRIITNKNYVNIADVSDEIIEHDFNKLSKIGKAQSGKIDRGFAQVSSQRDNARKSQKPPVNGWNLLDTAEQALKQGNSKAKEMSESSSKNNLHRSSNNKDDKNNNVNFFLSNPFSIGKDSNYNNIDNNKIDKINKPNYNNFNNINNDIRDDKSNKTYVNNLHKQDYNLSEIMHNKGNLETNKNASEENDKKDNRERHLQLKNNLNSYKSENKTFFLSKCFCYSFYINNKLKLNDFSLNFKKNIKENTADEDFSSCVHAGKAIDSFLSTRKISKRIFETLNTQIHLFKNHREGKNIILINKLSNESTDFLIKNLRLLKADPTNKLFLDPKNPVVAGANNFNFQFFYNPNSFEITKISFTEQGPKSEMFFSFIELKLKLIQETAEIVLSKLFEDESLHKQIRQSTADHELTSKYSNPKLLFSYLEVFGITSDNKIIGVVRNQAFFSICLSTKEYEAKEFLSFEESHENNCIKSVFHNQQNNKNPKIEVDIPSTTTKSNDNTATEKKMFYYFAEENNYYDNNQSLKFYTYNLTKQENKFELFAIDENLPKVYFGNVLNEHVICFFVYLSKENYELYCMLNNIEIDGNDAKLFLVYLLENKIVKLVFNFAKKTLKFFSEKLIREEKHKNFKPRSAYSNEKNYDYFVFFLNEDYQLVMYNFFTDKCKILYEYI